MPVLTLLLAAQQWVVGPVPATVGDTLWLERRVSAPAGWLVRPSRLPRGGPVEPLGDPVILRDGAVWVVRYPVTAWTTAAVAVDLPAIWLLGPVGEADSLTGGSATVAVASVLPDSGPTAPRPALAPVTRERRRPAWPALALLLGGALLGGALGWRRRRPRPATTSLQVPEEGEVADEPWLAAGEPRAIAARATHQLRVGLARAVPEAHTGLSTSECLEACARTLPAETVREVAEVLQALDRVAFASAHGADVLALARRARSLP